MPQWAAMWATAVALYAACKWLTFARVRPRIAGVGRGRRLAYLFAWPGMDAAAFLLRTGEVPKPSAAEWLFAVVKTLFGGALTWVAARTVLPERPFIAGWLGMIGLIFVLHFGTFHLLSVCWRSVGVDAMPLMRNPLASVSLAEFWGRRWNTAFHELAARFTFRPLRNAIGTTAASLAVFALSGLIHEIVISIPSHGGYGLPTGYFLVQGLGVAAERTPQGRRFGLGRGVRGRMFTMVVTAAPVFWLFPRPFITNVIVPMLVAIGAA